jgi:chromate transport protein ChrA
MNDPSAPIALTAHLAILSSISFGGFPTVLPDIRNFVVSTSRLPSFVTGALLRQVSP